MLVRQGAVYHFRRRVPERLRAVIGKRELWYSLRTTERQQAKSRAAALWVWTEQVFSGFGVSDVRGKKYIEGLLKQAQEIIERGGDASDLLVELGRGSPAPTTDPSKGRRRRQHHVPSHRTA